MIRVTRFFAYLAIVYFGWFGGSKYKLSIYQYFDINGLGNILGDFYTNSSGRPANDALLSPFSNRQSIIEDFHCKARCIHYSMLRHDRIYSSSLLTTHFFKKIRCNREFNFTQRLMIV
jgi:hypothetical protein